jgi:hypothetical protein
MPNWPPSSLIRIAPAVEPWLAAWSPATKAVPVLYISCDGTGTPMRAPELKGRRGKQPDGTAKTREVKLGAVFTQHRTDEKGHPVRDYASTTYVASYAPAAQFSLLLRAEARRRGVGSAAQVVFLSDGAAWAEDIAEQCFAGCVSILDFYHACERLHQLAAALGGSPAGRTRLPVEKVAPEGSDCHRDQPSPPTPGVRRRRAGLGGGTTVLLGTTPRSNALPSAT